VSDYVSSSSIIIDDHRVLYEKPAEWEHVSHSVASVVSLRDYLGKTILPTLNSDTQLSENVKRMRDACREFLKLVERMEQPKKGFFAHKDSNYRQFDIAVARLRREFAKALLALSLAYDLSITENLSQLISASPNFDKRLVSEDNPAE
jgi:hypothetical protein